MFQDIAEIISEKFEIPIEEIQPDSKFYDLNIDSLDVVDLIMDLENKYAITMRDEDTEKVRTVQELVATVEKLTR